MCASPNDSYKVVEEGTAVLRPILLVEDNPNDIELTLIALEKARLANPVVSLRDGAEALDYLRREGQWSERAAENPAVILLDKKLPKIDGHEVLKAVREDDSLKRIPIVMLTSSREEKDLLRSYDLGVNAYVVKPVEFDDFMDAINDLGVFWAVLNEPPPAR
jgi:CheY-like chemotaxis protein